MVLTLCRIFYFSPVRITKTLQPGSPCLTLAWLRDIAPLSYATRKSNNKELACYGYARGCAGRVGKQEEGREGNSVEVFEAELLVDCVATLHQRPTDFLQLGQRGFPLCTLQLHTPCLTRLHEAQAHGHSLTHGCMPHQADETADQMKLA